MMRACRRCGQAFQPIRPHFHSCWACWSADNSAAPPPAASAVLRENERLRCEVDRLRVLAAQPKVALDAVTIRQIIQMCHPDRNGGSALATTITQKLLKMRASAS